MGIAKLIQDNGSLWSHILEHDARKAESTVCKRKGVVATLYSTETQSPIFSGVNGPTPLDDRREEYCSGEVGKCGCIHAEAIACLWASQTEWWNLILLCSYSPCKSCANMITVTEKIIAVVYLNETQNYEDGKDILARNGIHCVQVEECDRNDPNRN